jgi:hypothetical protein
VIRVKALSFRVQIKGFRSGSLSQANTVLLGNPVISYLTGSPAFGLEDTNDLPVRRDTVVGPLTKESIPLVSRQNENIFRCMVPSLEGTLPVDV